MLVAERRAGPVGGSLEVWRLTGSRRWSLAIPGSVPGGELVLSRDGLLVVSLHSQLVRVWTGKTGEGRSSRRGPGLVATTPTAPADTDHAPQPA